MFLIVLIYHMFVYLLVDFGMSDYIRWKQLAGLILDLLAEAVHLNNKEALDNKIYITVDLPFLFYCRIVKNYHFKSNEKV